MIFHPAVMALLLADGVGLLLLLPAGWFAVQVLRHWDLQSGSARQIRLERRNWLVSTLLGFVFLVQILALLLFVFTADALAVQFVGAMCAVGTLNVNAWGFPALYLKLALFFLAAAWLFMNVLDNRAPDYPLVRPKYALLLLILPLAVIAAWVQLRYFLGLRADVITSCCGSLFDRAGESVASDLAGMDPLTAMVVFYSVLGATLVSGVYVLWRGRGVGWFAALSTLAFPVAIAAVVAFISLYVYEHPHHHCPFCLLKAEYGYVGYALYLPLFGATATGLGIGINHVFARAASLQPILAVWTPKAVRIALALWLLFALLAIGLSMRSNLVLLE